MMHKAVAGFAVLLLLLVLVLSQGTPVRAESCEAVVRAINARVIPNIDQPELIGALRSLNRTNFEKLPSKFVSKQEARALGWKPGQDLWSIKSLRGSSLGGDRFRNLEGRLPHGQWFEADLDYKGGHRGGKRLLFSRGGSCFVTVDHYRTFVEVPACR